MKKIRIGVFGAGARGIDLVKNFMLLGCDIVAFCEDREERRELAKEKCGADIALYDDFDAFLEHDMDAVILANFFNEHAPYAIKCFKKGIHVFSECISNGTMAEGVELIREYEKSHSIYFLAENYPQMIFNREIKRICDTKTLGKFLYAEGEYNHPGDPNSTWFKKEYVYFRNHWRNFLPGTYYITHSLGPIMHATGATPVTVTAFGIFAPDENEESPNSSYSGDRAAIITTQNDDGSVFRITGCASFGGHHNSYRVCGTNGQIENLRGMDDKIMLRYNEWATPQGSESVSLYEPTWNDKDEDLIKTSGHGGSDFITARMFLDCIRKNKQPEHPFNIYAAVAMSSVAILAHRSVLDGGKPYAIPDFRLEESKRQYENDRQSPFPGKEGIMPDIPCCSNPNFKPTERQLQLYDELIKSKDE